MLSGGRVVGGRIQAKRKKETQEKCGFTEVKRRKCLKKEGMGSSVEDRKISRKVIGDLDEQMFMGGSFANPFRVSLGKNGE